jgi:hemolysin D
MAAGPTRPVAGRFERMPTIRRQNLSAGRGQPGPGEDAAGLSRQAGRGASRQDRDARPPAGAETGRARHRRRHDPELEASSPIIKERVDIRKYLVDKELGSRLTYLETLQQLTENQKDLVVQKSRLQETDAALAGIISTRQQTEAEFRRTLFSELNEAERKAGGLADDLSKAERRTKLQLLTAPVDGVVQQLAVHTVGGVVTPAQQLAVIVPADAALEVEAMVSNRDIGFVHPGQEAQVKIDTFNFTRYGLLHGRVMSVSRDAIVRDIPQEAKNDQASARIEAAPGVSNMSTRR